MKILTALAIAALIIAFSSNDVNADTPNPNCLPTSPDAPTCLWQLELTKVEAAVEYEYPHCEVKFTVEHNRDELPEGATVKAWGLFHVPPGEPLPWWSNYVGWWSHNKGSVTDASNIHSMSYKFDHTDASAAAQVARNFVGWQSKTNGGFYAFVRVEYDWESGVASEFARERRVGNSFVHYKSKLPLTFVSDPIPISHTFAGLTEEVFACFEVAKRESARVRERSALDTEKAGLRATLKLLEAELARARKHELDATTVLKEVVAVATRIENVLRTIQRLRIEGIAEHRQLIERYYSEEARRYSVFVKSLEASEAALAASDKAIAAHKAEIEASRKKLNEMVTAAQAAEAALIAEIENAREALGTDEE